MGVSECALGGTPGEKGKCIIALLQHIRSLPCSQKCTLKRLTAPCTLYASAAFHVSASTFDVPHASSLVVSSFVLFLQCSTLSIDLSMPKTLASIPSTDPHCSVPQSELSLITKTINSVPLPQLLGCLLCTVCAVAQCPA